MELLFFFYIFTNSCVLSSQIAEISFLSSNSCFNCLAFTVVLLSFDIFLLEELLRRSNLCLELSLEKTLWNKNFKARPSLKCRLCELFFVSIIACPYQVLVLSQPSSCEVSRTLWLSFLFSFLSEGTTFDSHFSKRTLIVTRIITWILSSQKLFRDEQEGNVFSGVPQGLAGKDRVLPGRIQLFVT